MSIDVTNDQTEDGKTTNTNFPQLFLSDKRIDKLYEEIYADDSGGFMGFFSSSEKNKKDQRRLETYYGTSES